MHNIVLSCRRFFGPQFSEGLGDVNLNSRRMPEQEPLSILHLILVQAPVVLAVMGILFSASVISWIVIFQRAIYQNKASRDFVEFERQFWSGIDLTQLYRQGNNKAADGAAEGIESIFRSGFKEFTRLASRPGSMQTLSWKAPSAMRVALQRAGKNWRQGLPFGWALPQ